MEKQRDDDESTAQDSARPPSPHRAPENHPHDPHNSRPNHLPPPNNHNDTSPLPRVPPVPAEESPALYMTSPPPSRRSPPSSNDVAGRDDDADDVGADVSDGEKRAQPSCQPFFQSSASEFLSGSSESHDRSVSAAECSAAESDILLRGGDETEEKPSSSSSSALTVYDFATAAAIAAAAAAADDDSDGADDDYNDLQLSQKDKSKEERAVRLNEGGSGDLGEEEFCSDSEDEGYGGHSLYPRLNGWKALPAILLEDIFVLLTPKQRHQASMVCRPWYEIFYSPRVWETFILWERTLTKRRFNLYKGYQRELCPRKTQLCLMRVGCYIKRIIVTAISDYYNLYEFLRVLSSFLSFHSTFPMPLLSTFRFTFACESRGVNGTVIIGTGGNILSKLKDLITNLQQLHHLALNELLLEEEEVGGLLAAAACSSEHSLRYLELLNCSKVPVPVCEVTQFSRLATLKLSPQHLNEEVILMLGGCSSLVRLHVVQDAYTCSCSPVTHEAWRLFKEMAPGKRVFLEVEGRTTNALLLQPHAPVRGVVFRTPYHRLNPELVTWLLEYYASTLEYLVQEGLPRHHGSRKFSERADESLLRLVKSCPRLHTLVIRERISLSTMLILAREGKALRSLTLRKNALLKRCEWPRAPGWSDEFFRWLRQHGRDYDLAFQQMPVVMGRPWKPALDKTFKHLTVHVT